MLDLKLSARNPVVGLSKVQGAIVEFTGVTIFAQKPGDYRSSSTAQVPVIALFEHFHFMGGSEITFANWKYVGDFWVDKISSIFVVAGEWEFYSERDFKGDGWVYGPGLYDEIRMNIASFRVAPKTKKK